MSDEENVEGTDYESMSDRKARKHRFRKKMMSLLAEYKDCLVIQVDNVGSNQMQQVRSCLRGKAVMLMGKNTIMRKVIRDNLSEYPHMEAVLPKMVGNVGLVFSKEDLGDVRKMILENKVPAAAKSGAFAPIDVFVPPGPTGLDPGQTAFFQALNIATKIARGSIEIITKVHLIKAGDKVTASEVALLTKLDIKPFFYGIKCLYALENGSLYDAKFLDMTESDVLSKFFKGVSIIASIGLKIGYPTVASVPHSLINAFRKLVAISVATEYEFEEAKPFKEYLANPDAFKTADKDGSGSDDGSGSSEEESSESEESDGGAMSMFD